MKIFAHPYGTDLMQRRTHTGVVEHRSPCARTRSSVSFNGLELGLELGLKRKLKQVVQQIENTNKGAYWYIIGTHQIARNGN